MWFLFQETNSSSVGNELDESTVAAEGDYWIRANPEFQILSNANFLK